MFKPINSEVIHWIQRLVLLAFVVLGVFFYQFHESTHREVLILVDILYSMDAQQLNDYLLRFGYRAAVVSAGLMILQAIVAPIPAFVITIANGLFFGWFWGGLLSLISATLAAQLCFEISRLLGRPVMEQIIGKHILTTMDTFMARYGVSAILIARLLPVIPFDPVSYTAGLTSMPRRRFIISNLIGQIPATFIYSYFGNQLRNGLPWPIIFSLLGLTIIVLLSTRWLAPKNPQV